MRPSPIVAKAMVKGLRCLFTRAHRGNQHSKPTAGILLPEILVHSSTSRHVKLRLWHDMQDTTLPHTPGFRMRQVSSALASRHCHLWRSQRHTVGSSNVNASHMCFSYSPAKKGEALLCPVLHCSAEVASCLSMCHQTRHRCHQAGAVSEWQALERDGLQARPPLTVGGRRRAQAAQSRADWLRC